MTAAKSTKSADVNKQLHALTFDTVLGKVGFDAKGDLKTPGFLFYEWKNGTFDYMK